MATNFEQFASQATAPEPSRPAPSMFDFQPKQTVEDNFMTKEEVRQALANVPDKMVGLQKLIDGGFKLEGYNEIKTKQPIPEPSFGSGFAQKTSEAFQSGISRIGEAGTGLAEGKYTFPEAAVRGAAGSLQSFFSPVAGAIGQSVEQFVPEGVKAGVSSAVAPAIQSGREFYASQSPEQQRNLANIGVGAEVLANFLGGAGVSKVAGSQAGKTLAQEGAKTAVSTGKAVGSGIKSGAVVTGNAIANVPEYAISVATGLSRDTQGFIKSNPKIYKQARTGEITRETIFDETKSALDTRLSDLSELGRSYKDLRTGKVVANTDDLNSAFASATKDLDTIDLPISDRNAINEVRKYIDELKGDITDKQLLAMRKKIDSTISYDKGVSSEGQAAVRSIRSSVDDLAKSRIAGLAERDAKFAPEIKFLNKIKSTIYDAKGDIKDNALSSINNLTGKGKEFKIERFEKVLPGITNKINALKAFEEVQGIGEIKTGSIARQGGGIIAGTTTGGPVGAFLGFVLTHPGIAARILETYGMAKESVKSLLSKNPDKKIIEKASSIIKNANPADVEKIIISTKTISNPFKDIAFIKKLGEGKVKGLSKEALQAMKGAKTMKDAMARAKNAGVEDEIRKAYSKTK